MATMAQQIMVTFNDCFPWVLAKAIMYFSNSKAQTLVGCLTT